MKLKIKNIGKIKEAEIYVNGITVIAGYNDTGKSTVCRSLFALCDAFYKIGSNIHDERVSNIINAITESIARNFTFHIYYNKLIEIEAEAVLNSNNRQEVRNILEQIPLKMYKKLQEFRGITSDYSQDFELQFNKNLDNYKNEIFSKIEIALDMKNSIILTGIVSRTLKAEFAGQICCALNKKQGIFTLSNNDESVSITVENNQEQNIVIDNMSFQTEKAIYIDNAVNDINPSRREIFSLLTTTRKLGHRRLLKADLMKTPEDYNLIDNLSAQEKLSLIMKKVSMVSKGALIQDKDRNIWHYSLRGQDKSILLNIENVSTGILAFATLRRLIENGSLQESEILILDEPETHLHPEWQNIFAEIIVLLCRDFDLKILLNTHSHYFLTAIENFSRKYGIDDKCKYYLSYNERDMVSFRDVTGKSDEIYKKFLQPIQDMQDIDDEE